LTGAAEILVRDSSRREDFTAYGSSLGVRRQVELVARLNQL
jgi:hypothetical protein